MPSYNKYNSQKNIFHNACLDTINIILKYCYKNIIYGKYFMEITTLDNI